eukprot:GHRR01009450.1.p1 GENE.GHRR01009450.1~~GHRR01009450.1.p1  ORF type:complete len:161 (-),score=50.12 GHRR01009450.1:1665-2147(-)
MASSCNFSPGKFDVSCLWALERCLCNSDSFVQCLVTGLCSYDTGHLLPCRDECPSRGMLMTAMRIFEHLHEQVFSRLHVAPPSSSPDAAAVWDIRNIMAAEKRQVLAGVCLVFSRVIPLEANPRQHPLWQLAEQFGAVCEMQCSDNTTHVVATHGGTEKV